MAREDSLALISRKTYSQKVILSILSIEYDE